tara:strand:- start:1115 stop:1732 length:618 start_codon:yes stop_codon:yes gene_type:complete
MKLKDLTPKGIKLNEAKMTPAKVQKVQKDLVKTIDTLKKNFPMYKAAKDAGDDKKLEKHRKIALDLTKKKKELEKALDAALGGLYQDAELELKEAEKELDYQAPPDADKDDIKIDPDTDFKVDLKHLIDKHMVKEANPDGTISPNEDKEMKELLEDIESRMEDILYEADQETRRIGGQFRQPGYKAQIVKLLSKMVEGFSKGERF